MELNLLVLTQRDKIHKILSPLLDASQNIVSKIKIFYARFDRSGVVISARNLILHWHYISQPFVAYVTGVIYLVITLFDFDPYVRGIYTTFSIFYYLSIKKFKLQKMFWGFLFLVTVLQFYMDRVHPGEEETMIIRIISVLTLIIFTCAILFFQKTIVFRSSRYDYWSVTYLINLRHFIFPSRQGLDTLLAGAKDVSKIRQFKYEVHHKLNAHLARFQGLSNILDIYMHENDLPKVLQTAVMMQQVAVEIRMEILEIVNEFHSELEKDMTND